jgi:hypothetical protein
MRARFAKLGLSLFYPLAGLLILIPPIAPSIRRAYERRIHGRPGWLVYFFSQLLGLVALLSE